MFCFCTDRREMIDLITVLVDEGVLDLKMIIIETLEIAMEGIDFAGTMRDCRLLSQGIERGDIVIILAMGGDHSQATGRPQIWI